MRKKLLTLALALIVVLSFAACGKKSMTLAEWIASDEAQTVEEATNAGLEGTGITVKLAADGNTFVYEYTLPAGDYSEMTTDTLAANFDPVIEQNKASLTTMFSTFESEYGIKLDGARFVFLTSDGTELYAGDVANE